MPRFPLSPGTYVQEVPAVRRPIVGAPTGVTAFVGHARSGAPHQAQTVDSFVDFERLYGGLASDSALGYAVQQFFMNGGRQAVVVHTPGANGGLPATADIIGDRAAFTGIYALLRAESFNLLCIPDAVRAEAGDPTKVDASVDTQAVYAAAIAQCSERRAFLLVDPPADVTTVAAAADWKANRLGITAPDGAAFFPRLLVPDSLDKGRVRAFPPCGAVAGIYATAGVAAGVWKTPAGAAAVLKGVNGLSCPLDERAVEQLNPMALNCFRTLPSVGTVLWGGRTLAGAADSTSPWRYVAVRRTALYIEESIRRGTAWAAFEANAESLWAALRADVGMFLYGLFLEGAFRGSTPPQAFFVRCDRSTTSQDDIANGVAKLLVGFAPQKPAEFELLRFAIRTA